MKKLLILLFALGVTGAAMAQRGHVVVSRPAYSYYHAPRVVIGMGAYAPFYYGFGMGPWFGYPYPYPYAYGYRPSRMDMKIEDIRSDYRDKIRSAKSDDALTKSERKAKVHELKQERDQAINDLKKNYYKY